MLDQKGNLLIGILIGLFIAGGLFGVYYSITNKPVYQIPQQNTKTESIVRSEPSIKPSPVLSEVPDKKVYTNIQYGYSLEYLADLLEVDDKSSSVSNVIYVQTKGYTRQTSQERGAYQIEVNAMKDKILTVNEYIHSKDNTPESSFIKNQDKTTINGNPAVITTYKSASDDPNIGNRNTQKQYYIYSKNLGVVMTGSGPLDEKNTDHAALDTLVSSFKFTN